MNSFKGNTSNTDRVDPKSVAPSRHSVFIRGFPSNMQMEQVRTFFKTETSENCKIDFFSYSDDRKKLFVALRFESHEKAVDVIESYDGREVLGYPIEVSWFKDLRKARKKLIEEERFGRHRNGHSPAEWSGGGGRSYGRMPMWPPGRYMRGGSRGGPPRGMMRGGRDSGRRFSSRGGSMGWRRGGRSSPSRNNRFRREQSRSSRSFSRSRSRTRSRSRSGSSKSRRRSYSSYSSRRSSSDPEPASGVRGGGGGTEIGHDPAHRYRVSDRQQHSDEKVTVTAANTDPDNTALSRLIRQDYDDDDDDSDSSAKPSKKDSAAAAAAAVNSASDSSDSEHVVNTDSKAVDKSVAGAKKHHKKSKKKAKKKRGTKKSADSDENSSDSNDDQRCVTLIKPDNISSDKFDGLDSTKNKSPGNTKDVKESTNPNGTVNASSKPVEPVNLSAEDHIKVLSKKEILEKIYKKDCETVASVAKLFISKKPMLEEDILVMLKSVFSDIGEKYLDELRSFISTLTNTDSKNAMKM